MFLAYLLLPKKLQDGFHEDLYKNHNEIYFRLINLFEIYFWLIDPSKAPSIFIPNS